MSRKIGFKHSEKTKKKIGDGNRNKIVSDDTKEKMSKSQKGKNKGKTPMLGKHHSEDTKKKISEGSIGRIPWNKGKHHSEDTKQKMREKRKGRKPHEGCQHSEETKNKISIKCSNPPEERRKRWSEKRKKENNPNWKGGILEHPYCEKWTEKLKERIRERDNRICQECSKTEKENIEKLSVHHIHYDKENCYPDLISLCVSCNTRANGNRYYWEEHFMKILKRRNLLNYFGNRNHAN